MAKHDKYLTKLTKELDGVYTRINWWAAHRAALAPVLDALEATGAEAAVGNGSVDVNITGGRRELNLLFRTMRELGWSPCRRPTEGETSYYSYWNNPDLPDVSIWTSFCSNVCKRVQVGTEMKEVPVYEVQCGDSMVLDEEVASG